MNGVPVSSAAQVSSYMSVWAQQHVGGYEDEMLEYVSPNPSAALPPATDYYGSD